MNNLGKLVFGVSLASGSWLAYGTGDTSTPATETATARAEVGVADATPNRGVPPMPVMPASQSTPTTSATGAKNAAPKAREHEPKLVEHRSRDQEGKPSPAVIESYLNGAVANLPAERSLGMYFDSQPVLQALEHGREIDCRGWICKATLTFRRPRDAGQLMRMQQPEDVDVSYVSRAVDMGETTVIVYSALRGAKLSDIVAADSEAETVFDSESALARASEVESKWRSGHFESGDPQR